MPLPPRLPIEPLAPSSCSWHWHRDWRQPASERGGGGPPPGRQRADDGQGDGRAGVFRAPGAAAGRRPGAPGGAGPARPTPAGAPRRQRLAGQHDGALWRRRPPRPPRPPALPRRQWQCQCRWRGPPPTGTEDSAPDIRAAGGYGSLTRSFPVGWWPLANQGARGQPELRVS